MYHKGGPTLMTKEMSAARGLKQIKIIQLSMPILESCVYKI